jgi:hypothetical protein
MHNLKSLFRTVCKVLGISVLFIVIMIPIHDEMNPSSLEKDIITHSHVLEHKIKKINLAFGTLWISFLQTSHNEPDFSKTPTIFSSFSLFKSFANTILLL